MDTITYNYDGSGLLTDTIDFNGDTTHYDNNGRIKSITRPNGTTRTTTYDAAGQVKTIIDTNAKGEMICNYSFDYDAGGKIKEEKGLNENLTITNGETIMTYGKGNRLLTYNGQEVKYDADGNMTYGPLDGKMVEFKYDARNRLIQAGTTTYQYDAENNRIGKSENGETTTYVVDTTSGALSKVLVEKKGNTVRQYIYATGLIMHVEGGEYATYHYDNRGSTVAITNKQGKVTDTFTYGPYGEQYGRTGKTKTPFLYNGRYGVETDANGLYYMRARYYNPDIKRFINQDVVQGSLDNAITLNRFAYANGNPISYLDPFGLAAIPDLNYRPRDAQDAARYTAELKAYKEACLTSIKAFDQGDITFLEENEFLGRASELQRLGALSILKTNHHLTGEDIIALGLMSQEEYDSRSWHQKLFSASPSDIAALTTTAYNSYQHGSYFGDWAIQEYSSQVQGIQGMWLDAGMLYSKDYYRTSNYHLFGNSRNERGSINLTNRDSKSVGDFEKMISKMPANERVAAIKTKVNQIAKDVGLIKDNKLSRINGRDIYRNPKTGEMFALDTQHGRFEVINSRNGKHMGEVDFNFNPTKVADASGGHNIKTK